VTYAVLGDLVVALHLAFIVFVAVGGFLAWRWSQLRWLHVPAVVWSAGIVAIGYRCPLTTVENHLRRLGGEAGYDGGFVDRYLTGVVYPGAYAGLLQALLALAVVVSWAGLAQRHRRAAPVHGSIHPSNAPRALP
jgi:hypothetical protein